MYYCYCYSVQYRFIVCNPITGLITADLLLVNFHYSDGVTRQVSL